MTELVNTLLCEFDVIGDLSSNPLDTVRMITHEI